MSDLLHGKPLRQVTNNCIYSRWCVHRARVRREEFAPAPASLSNTCTATLRWTKSMLFQKGRSHNAHGHSDMEKVIHCINNHTQGVEHN